MNETQTALRTAEGYSEKRPDSVGLWLYVCGENSNIADHVAITAGAKGRLMVHDASIGIYDVEHFHNGLTGSMAELEPVWKAYGVYRAEQPTGKDGTYLIDHSTRTYLIDRQGRVLIPQLLRETAAMAGEVSVLGQQNHLAVWSRKRLEERLFKKEPFTEEDGRLLAEHGI